MQGVHRNENMAKIVFTAGLVAAFKCPPDKTQAFLWDAQMRGMGLRATRAGSAAFVFQSTHNGRTLRVTIGSPKVWTIAQAREKASELARQIAAGLDPRGRGVAGGVESFAVNVAKVHAAPTLRRADQRRVATVGEAWTEYLLARRPAWSERHYRDHLEKAAPGGTPSGRGGLGGGVGGVGGGVGGGVVTLPGPLAPLLPLPLRDIDADTVARWAYREAATRPTSARLAWRLLKAFLGWCADQPAFAALLPRANPARTHACSALLGTPTAKSDALQPQQLRIWFDAVRAINNPVVGAYLQTALLTGARPGELLTLRWDDLNTQWNTLTLRASAGTSSGTSIGTSAATSAATRPVRTIPLTPYVAHTLTVLPRRNEWVFSGPRAPVLARPNELHTRICTLAGLHGLTLHGLRRSFKTLSEWVNAPATVVAQLLGRTRDIPHPQHTPDPAATSQVTHAHPHARPLELLHQHHVRIEAWILEQAGVGLEVASGDARN